MAGSTHRLPVQPTALIGREREVGAVRDLLLRADVRLVTLTGPGGTGKTRVAVEAASGLAEAFADGAVFVGLAPIRDPALVLPTIAQAVGARDTGNRPILEIVTEYLRERQVLLVLDNCEQVLAAGPALADVLAGCAAVKLLATSRAPLHLRGEREYPVSPLPLPARMPVTSGADRQTNGADRQLNAEVVAEVVSESPAVQLFVARALDVRPDFVLTDKNASDVAEICRRLDGLPLAIELAAARVKLLPPRVLLARMDRRLPLLTGGPRDAPARQQTLRDTIAWSYDLLDASEQRVFRALSVFVGGFTLDGAGRVASCELRVASGEVGTVNCAPTADDSVGAQFSAPTDAINSQLATRYSLLDLVSALVDNSLVRAEESADGETRFTMLETIREYGLELLATTGEEPAVRRRHLHWYADLAERNRNAFYGPGGTAWLERLAAEHDNIRSALDWSLTDPSETSVRAGLRLAGSSHNLWYFRDFLAEGRQWLRRVLTADDARTPDSPRDADAETISPGEHERGPERSSRRGRDAEHPRVRALITLSNLSQQLGDLREAGAAASEALLLARAVGDHAGEGDALVWLGTVARSSGEYDRALALFQESTETCRRYDDLLGSWRAFGQLGETRLRVGDFEGARSALEESLARARQLGYRVGEAQTLERLAVVVFRSGDLDGASALLDECLAIYGEVATRGRHSALLDRGQIALAQGDRRRAAPSFFESLALCHRAGDRYNLARCLDGLAGCVAAGPDARRGERSDAALAGAARLLGAAAALRAAIDFTLPPVERPAVEQATATVRARLGDEAYRHALAEGRTLPLDRIVALARDLAQSVQRDTLDNGSDALDDAGTARADWPPRAADLPRLPGRGASLTPREREVAILVGRGYSNRRIAEALVIAEKTAEVHAHRVREKLGLSSRAQIAAWAAREGLLGDE